MINDKILIAFDDESFKFLTHQLSMVGYWPSMTVQETAATSKTGSRRVNYPILTQGGSDKK